MTGLSLGDNMILRCQCGGEFENLGDGVIQCEECGRDLDKEMSGQLDTVAALHHIGLDPEKVYSIRYTSTQSKEYNPRLIFSMRNGEKLTLCKVLKEEHLNSSQEDAESALSASIAKSEYKKVAEG